MEIQGFCTTARQKKHAESDLSIHGKESLSNPQTLCHYSHTVCITHNLKTNWHPLTLNDNNRCLSFFSSNKKQKQKKKNIQRASGVKDYWMNKGFRCLSCGNLVWPKQQLLRIQNSKIAKAADLQSRHTYSSLRNGYFYAFVWCCS